MINIAVALDAQTATSLSLYLFSGKRISKTHNTVTT